MFPDFQTIKNRGLQFIMLRILMNFVAAQCENICEINYDNMTIY